MRAAGNDVVDKILMRNLKPIIDDRHLDPGSADAERVQDVHIQIHAWTWTLVAEHRLALIEQMPLVAEQRIGVSGFRGGAVCRVGACNGIGTAGGSDYRCCSQHPMRRASDQQRADQRCERRLRKECITAKARAGVMSVYPETAKKRISIHGMNAVRSCIGSPARGDAADIGSAFAPATLRVRSGSSVPAMLGINGACVIHRTIYDVFTGCVLHAKFSQKIFCEIGQERSF